MDLAIESGDRQAIPLADPVVFRLTDENNLPYAGVTIKALTGSGSLDAASAVTDADGRESFLWKPGAAALVHEMTAGLDGGPAATVTAIGRALATPESIVNAASFRPGLAPGMIATVFGANLGGGKVTIGGRAAKVIFDSVRQLNFVVPLDVPAGSVEVRISTFVGETVVGEVRVYSTLPGVFAARNAGSGFVEIYATGLGVLNGAETMARPLVTIDSQPADLVFSGLAPGFEGLYQVNARLTGLGGGKHTVTVSVGGVASNAVAF